MNFKHGVFDTSYRRLIDGRSIDIYLGAIDNIVVNSDIDGRLQTPVFFKVIGS